MRGCSTVQLVEGGTRLVHGDLYGTLLVYQNTRFANQYWTVVHCATGLEITPAGSDLQTKEQAVALAQKFENDPLLKMTNPKSVGKEKLDELKQRIASFISSLNIKQ